MRGNVLVVFPIDADQPRVTEGFSGTSVVRGVLLSQRE